MPQMYKTYYFPNLWLYCSIEGDMPSVATKLCTGGSGTQRNMYLGTVQQTPENIIFSYFLSLYNH